MEEIKYKCFKCKSDLESIKTLFKHFRNRHGLYENCASLILVCPVCELTFKTYCGYKRHLLKCILPIVEHEQIESHLDNETTEAIERTNYDNSLVNDIPKENNENLTEPDLQCPDFDIKSYLLNYTTKLHSFGIAESSIQVIMKSTEELVLSILEDTLEACSKHVEHGILEKKIESITSEFKSINTIYKRQKELNKNIVSPKEIAIGTRIDQVFCKTNQIYVRKNVTCTFVYIPILSTLEYLLRNDAYLNLIMQSPIDSTIISDITDGDYVKAHPLFKNHKNLKINLYYDDFEVTNPLGSKTGGHKVGAFYFTIRNIPSFMNSQLHHIIHLLALCYASDIKQFGFNKILTPIVNDIKILESQGIYIESKQITLYGSLVALSHDNLGGNSLLGMVESFSATNYCRICLVDKHRAQKTYKEDLELLRNAENYNQHCSEVENSNNVFGIKYRSILSDLEYFDFFESPSVDAMHDILEGIASYEIKLVLKHLIEIKVTNINVINLRLASFPFSRIERCDVPSPLILDKPGHLIGQRAAQTWCLIRFFPLLFSDLFPEHTQTKLNIILSLIECMQIIFAPRVSIDHVNQLQILIETHLGNFVKEFGLNLIPKHHMLIHYPRVIKLLGPLTSLWSMRFEAKHGYFKNLVPKLRNFTYICLTLANRHQVDMYHNWENKSFDQKEYGPEKIINYETYLHRNILPLEVNRFSRFKWIKYGYIYKLGFYVCIKIDTSSQLPIFGKILDIILINRIDYFVIQPWKTLRYDDKICVYVIKDSSQTPILINDSSLIYREPFEKYQLRTGYDYCIVPKYIYFQ